MKALKIGMVLLMCGIGTVQAQIKPAEPKPKPKIDPKAKKKEVPYTKFSIKAGGNLSVIYLARNTKDNNNQPGWSCGGLYAINGFVRVSCLYTAFKTLDIEPTWRNVKAHTYEANLEVLARFPNKKTLLYPFVGVSYNTYRGFFTGQNDYLNLKEFYPVNTTVSNHWLGGNIGLGIEHDIGPFGLYIDYRMRVGRQEKSINVMDVCYSGGLKIRIPQLRVNGKKIFRNPNDRFHWF